MVEPLLEGDLSDQSYGEYTQDFKAFAMKT